MSNIRQAFGRLVAKAFDLQSLWLQGGEVPWTPGYSGGVNVSAAYENSDMAYSCIRRKATDISSAPLKFLVNPEDDTREVPPSHPIRKLWNRPHPSFSREQVMQLLVTYLELRGECFLAFDDPDRPTIMYPWYDPQWWKDSKTSEGELVIWRMQHQTMIREWLPSEVMYHRYVSVAEPLRGQPPLRAAAKKYAIATGGDSLQESLIKRGGERSILYEAPLDYTPDQREAALAALRGRRQRDNTIGRDQMLPVGIKVVDPRFVQDDYDILAALPRSDEGICNVYGVPASLLSGKEDNYATFKGRMRIYWSNTLVPAIRGIESAFDRYFGLHFGVYVRFDLGQIEALKDNYGELVDVAVKLVTNGVPWREVNDRLALGLDADSIPTADTWLVNGMLLPADVLIEEAHNPPPPPPTPPQVPASPQPPPADDEDGKGASPQWRGNNISRSLLITRARDPRAVLARTRRMAALERSVKLKWRTLMHDTKSKAVRAVERAGNDSVKLKRFLTELEEPTRTATQNITHPAHITSAREGMLSVLLLLGKADYSDQQDILEKAAPELSPNTKTWIRMRTNFIDQRNKRLFREILDTAQRAVIEGLEVSNVADLVADKFSNYAARAATIGRTEVGCAFNVSRFEEMKEQGFEKHEWLTAEDELVRDDHANCDGEVVTIGDQFSCGLAFPMEDGGEPEQVINCRCSTIPAGGGDNED